MFALSQIKRIIDLYMYYIEVICWGKHAKASIDKMLPTPPPSQ